jgi:arylsulfatase A-like enzyme
MRWRPAALLLAAAVSACSHPPRYHVTARLLEHLPPSLADWVAGDCSIGDQHRPALGCTAWRPRGRYAVEGGRHPRLSFPLDAKEGGRPVIVRVVQRTPGLKGTVRRLPEPELALVAGARATVFIPNFPPPDLAPDTEVLLWSRLPFLEVYRTTPVKIVPGSSLSVGVGLDPQTPPAGIDAVEFTLTADAGTGSHELLHAVVRPGGPGTSGWEEHVVPLDAVAGEATVFQFRTWIKVAEGVDRNTAVAMPLWGAPEVLTPEREDDHPNVILVSLDTLRRDYVGAFGSTLPLTPHIDALAAEGTVFENATTTFPSTTGAHLSMLTGLYPIRLGVDDPTRRIQTSARLLAEAIGAAGWRTAAVTEDVMLAIPVGFARGFAHYQENLEEEPRAPPSYKVEHTMDAAVRWLEQNHDDRFFLFLHTYAVHWPYAAPPQYQFTTWKDPSGVERPVDEAPGDVQLRLRYAADVRQADMEIGRLVDTLRRLRLERRTILVVTADHGEAFFEHYGRWGHGVMIYDEIMRVPVVMWGPGRIPAGRRIRTPVSLVDLPPTILDLAGAPPMNDIDGESQVARLRGGPEDLDRVVFAESPPIKDFHEHQTVARALTTKWILTASTPPELVAYDLVSDPGEQRPLADPAVLERGRQILAGYTALGAKRSEPTRVPVSDETRQRLKALGYAQ